jgi:hypothetical protein
LSWLGTATSRSHSSLNGSRRRRERPDRQLQEYIKKRAPHRHYYFQESRGDQARHDSRLFLTLLLDQIPCSEPAFSVAR